MGVSDYKVTIDWDRDGNRWDTGNEVTDRVKPNSLRYGRGSDFTALQPPAAGNLDLEIDNRSKDYSSEYNLSPLVGLLDAGAEQRVWAALVRDDFDRANSTTTLGSPDFGPGGAWTILNGGTWGISSNEAYQVTSTTHSLAYVETSQADGVVRAILTTPADGASICGRVSDGNNLWLLQANVTSGQYDFYKRVASGYSLVANLAKVPAAGDELLLEFVGSKITARVGTVTATTTDSFNSTATKHGIRGNLTGGRLNDFRFYVAQNTAYLQDLVQHPQRDRKTVSAPGLGYISRLVGKFGTASILYAGIRTDQAIGYLLDSIGETDTAKRVFDAGHTTLEFFWVDPERDIWEQIQEVVNTEGPGASLYEDALGRLVFKQRLWINTEARATTPQVAFKDTSWPTEYADTFNYDKGVKHVINQCTVTQHVRTQSVVSNIWQLGEVFSLGALESRDFIIEAANKDPFYNATTPAVGTDYTTTAAVSVSLNQTSGVRAVLTVTAGAGGATVSGPTGTPSEGIKVRALATPIVYTNVIQNRTPATASIAKYGLRPFTLNIRHEVSLNTLRDFCDAVVALYQEPRSTVEMEIVGADSARLQQILTRELGDRITVYEPHTGINFDLWLRYRADSVPGTSGHPRAVWRLEKATTSARYFVIGTSTLGGSDVLGY